MAYNVIDISKYQGDINFATVKSRVDGVIVRAGYRGYGSAGTIAQDPYAVAYINACIENDIPYGVYFFSQAVNAAEGQVEANWTLSFLKQFSVQPLFPVYIDTESSGAANNSGRADGITVAARTAAVKAFCETVEAVGYYAGIYASSSWFKSKLTDSSLTTYTHWVAHYGVSAPTYSGKYDMWQYSSSGSISGISGRVDVNYAYIDFPAVTKANGLNGYNKDDSTPVTPSDDTDPKYVRSYPCYLKIGYASSGDLVTFKNMLATLVIDYTEADGYLTTTVKMSVGDQVTIKAKCKELGVGIVEYIDESEPDQKEETNPIVNPTTDSWVVKLIKFLLDLFGSKANEE